MARLAKKAPALHSLSESRSIGQWDLKLYSFPTIFKQASFPGVLIFPSENGIILNGYLGLGPGPLRVVLLPPPKKGAVERKIASQ